MDRKKHLILFIVAVFSLAAGFGLLGRGDNIHPNVASRFIIHQAHAQTVDTAPTNVSTTALSASAVSISWSAPVAGTSTFAGYYVYRNGQQVADTTATSFIDAGLVPGLYVYTVAMFDVNGNVYPASAPSIISLTLDTTPPSAPTGVTVSAATTSTNSEATQIPITISWTASTDNVGVAGYNVYRSGLLIVSSTSPFTGTSITDTVTPGTYSYTVTAYDAAGNISSASTPVSVSISVDNAPPSVPLHLVAQQNSTTGINLSWASSTDNVGVAGYQVFRNGTQIASTTSPSYSDSGLSTNTNYVYYVTAYDAAGNVSVPSLSAQATVETYNGPVPPIIWSAVLQGTSTVSLSWIAGGDPLPITSYALYRGGTQIASVTSTSYLDRGLASGTYAYSLSETDASGATSAISSSTSVVVPAYVPTSSSTLAAIPTTATPIENSITPLIDLVLGSTTVLNNSATVTAPTGLSPDAATALSDITQFLYMGLRSPQVQELQNLLAQNGYLSSADTTGYFGALTQKALQQFQCDKAIVCTGGAGWGTVGPRTRNALNGLIGEVTQALPSLLSSTTRNPTSTFDASSTLNSIINLPLVGSVSSSGTPASILNLSPASDTELLQSLEAELASLLQELNATTTQSEQ